MKLKFEKKIAKHLGLDFPDNDPVWTDSRRVLITGGYRAGKTTRGAFKAFKEALNPKTQLIWLIGPDYVQAQEEFRMILEWALEMNLVARNRDGSPRFSMPAEGARIVYLRTGCKIQTKSAKHPETLASVAPDGIILCEPGQMTGEVFDIALGRLAQKRGWLFMCGTLEDDTAKPRWAWYEAKAVEWSKNPPGSLERSFTVPSWTNRFLYPKGLEEPELINIKSTVSEYKWNRMYAGIPQGVEHPVFPFLWEPSAMDEFMIPCDALYWEDGAIGVDYGRTFEHPSAIVVVSEDNYGRYWIREAWEGIRADYTEILSVVEALKDRYGIYQGCVDPNQNILAEMCNFQLALGGGAGGKPSEMRFSLVNGVLENRSLFFDAEGNNVDKVWKSMRMCSRTPNQRGELLYNRPLGDDLAQACAYAFETLRGKFNFIPEIEAGGAQMIFAPGRHMEGRA